MYLFDMDGTLIDSNSVWKDVDREFLAGGACPIPKPIMREWLTPFFHWLPSLRKSSAICRRARRPLWRSGWILPKTPMPM